MTAKPKPSKGAAKEVPVKPAPAGTPREVSEIERLFTRTRGGPEISIGNGLN
jgi:hypothetical protein